MEVTVRLFAVLRERAGSPELTLDLPDGASVGDALEQLSGLAGDVPLVMAVNREYASEEQLLDAGDELALIPPVSGGDEAVWARVSAEALSLDSLAERVRDPRAGAVVTFSGVTRKVERLEYEAYAEMAEERMEAIAAAAVESHGLCAAAVEHRVGAGPLVGAERDRRRVRAPPGRGLRRRPRDHRPGQGRRPDLEEGGRGGRGALGRGHSAGAKLVARRDD